MTYNFPELIETIKKLRSPEGCPWDRKQTPASTRAHLIEEMHELSDAIIENDSEAIKEEGGDLLFLTMFLLNFYDETNQFTPEDAIAAVVTKMKRRHPHVFSDLQIKDENEVLLNWEKIKATEKDKAARTSILDGLPKSLPPFTKSLKMQEKVKRVGFDWDNNADRLAKIKEELQEVEVELKNSEMEKLELEIGDLLFSIVNLSMNLGIDPEVAISKTNKKFERRFHFVEKGLKKKNKKITESNLSEMDELWNEAKKEETSNQA